MINSQWLKLPMSRTNFPKTFEPLKFDCSLFALLLGVIGRLFYYYGYSWASSLLFLWLWKSLTKYSRLSLSQSPRDSLKYFEISLPRDIRFADLRKTINWTNTFHKWICKLTPEVGDILEIFVEMRRNCSLGVISPLFHIILLAVVRFPCLNRDQIFTSR